MPESKKNTLVKAPQRPTVAPPIKPQIPHFNQFHGPTFKGSNFKGPNTFSNTAFRNQNRGSGGK
jgi:hypothetical protein